MDNAGLLAELNHAVRLVLLLGPSGVLHFSRSLEAFHQVIESPLILHIADYNCASNFLNLSGIVEGGQCRVLRQVELHELRVVGLNHLLGQLSFDAIDDLRRQL